MICSPATKLAGLESVYVARPEAPVVVEIVSAEYGEGPKFGTVSVAVNVSGCPGSTVALFPTTAMAGEYCGTVIVVPETT